MDPILELNYVKKYFDVPHGTLHAVDNITLSIGGAPLRALWENRVVANPL